MSATADHDTDPRPDTTAATSGADAGGDEATPLQYPTVEAWVRDYVLPSFPRPVGELGASGRWRWCEQWWKHDESVTILTALWYGWEHAAVQTLGMLDWLSRLLLPADPVRRRRAVPTVACANGDLPARHDMPAPADVVPAPPGWWNWWSAT